MAENQDEDKKTSESKASRRWVARMGYPPIPSLSSIKTSGDPEHLIELFVRLMYRVYPILSGGGNVYITAGGAPEALHDSVPLPDESRVIGSTHTSEGSTVVLETTLTKEQVREFYLERLVGLGWSKPEGPMGMRNSGFEYQIPEMEQMMGLTFCGGDNGPALTIRIFDDGDGNGATDVILNYLINPQNSPCDKRQRMQHRMMMPESILPSLSAPRGDIQVPGGGGRSGGQESSSAKLRSDKPLEEIARHYQAQLENAGWTVMKEMVEESSAQSTYSFQDGDENQYRGYLLVLARPEAEGMYYVSLEADESGKQDGMYGRGGWSWYL